MLQSVQVSNILQHSLTAFGLKIFFLAQGSGCLCDNFWETVRNIHVLQFANEFLQLLCTKECAVSGDWGGWREG